MSRILIDVCHPAHVHFFRNAISELSRRGHELTVTSRRKEMALDLLGEFDIEHVHLPARQFRGPAGLLLELVQRDTALTRLVRRLKPDVLGAVGGIFVAHVGALTGTRSLVFYDTENATLQNALTYPLATGVIVPRCYQGWLPKRHLRYAGYHELAYLHPHRFQANRDTAIANGLDPARENFFLRVVAWQANHDLGESGWSETLLRQVVEHLGQRGQVIISSEAPLPRDLECMQYRGDISTVHHVMAQCRLYVGESATMASECAVLGVPAIYAAQTGRGYTEEQETRYGLVQNIHEVEWSALRKAIDRSLSEDAEHWAVARQRLLEDCIDVTELVADCLEDFSAQLTRHGTAA